MTNQTAGSLTKHTAAGVLWLLMQAIGSRGIGFASQLFLAKLLLPADFGTLGLAITVTAIFAVLATFGVDEVLLQRQRTIAYWSKPAFIVSITLAILATTTICAAAPFAAAIYKSPSLTTMLPVMALAMPIGVCGLVPSVTLRAELRFKLLAQMNLAEQALTQGLTIGLAWLGFGALSFALPLPTVAVIRVGFLWMVARPRFRHLRRGQIRHMFKRGSAVFASRLLTASLKQGDYALLGALTNPSIVGAYFFAFRLAVQPIETLAGNFQTVLFPALALLRNEPKRQRRAAINASRILASAAMPYCFLQAALARPGITLLFGAKWSAAIPLIQILSIGLAFDAVSWMAGALLSARGEFSRALFYSCVFLPVFYVPITIGALVGSAGGVAVAVSLFYICMGPIYSYLVLKSSDTGLYDIASIYATPALLAAGSLGLAVLVDHAFNAAANPIVSIIFIGTAGITIYGLLLRFVAPALFDALCERFMSLMSRQSNTPALVSTE